MRHLKFSYIFFFTNRLQTLRYIIYKYKYILYYIICILKNIYKNKYIFYLEFLSGTFTIHRTARKKGACFFKSSLLIPLS